MIHSFDLIVIDLGDLVIDLVIRVSPQVSPGVRPFNSLFLCDLRVTDCLFLTGNLVNFLFGQFEVRS